ncbi:hypothetical protein PAHAL_3G049600 [Panicum hallii]|jgi:pyruvate dehydrogenase E2 component (dihydrolipoamide acetyltransferase)|uniref:WEB family protein n=1 Tax=Panicum hallii TaxID=206008 RepID=A0A2S3H689_9POAL|nr:uncharacterized protein LOC112886916 [Panicum hallii]PAN16268.1 hypothetical protein PAHAL_3G049600 [Panicum hallii]
MASDRGEVDTSRAFRSVKEAVAVFGEHILVRQAQIRPNGGGHGDRRVGREVNPRADGVAVAASDEKLERSDGVRASGLHPRESYSKPSVTFNAKQEASSSNNRSASTSNELPVPVPRPVSEDVPMYLVPTSPPFFASSPSLANDDEEQERKEADLMVLSSIKKLEEEAGRTRQEVSQLKRRLAEMELSMATLNAKLHRALSKVAHMEADNAAAARASIERGRSGDMALAVWAERRAPSRPQLGHLLRLGEADRDAVVSGGGRAVVAPARKVQKQKPIIPLVVPLINGVLFSKKRKTKDKESMYMKELYSLLRLS